MKVIGALLVALVIGLIFGLSDGRTDTPPLPLRELSRTAMLKAIKAAGGTKRTTYRLSQCVVTSDTTGECRFYVHFLKIKGWPASSCTGTLYIESTHYRAESDSCG